MKKLISVCLVFFCSVFIYAQSEDADGSDPYAGVEEDLRAVADRAREAASDGDEAPAEAETAENDAQSEKRLKRAAFLKGEGAALSTGQRASRRYFEIGLLDLNLSLAGLDMTKFFTGDILNFGNLDVEQISGFTGDIRLFTNPLYVKIPIKNVFTLDFFTGAQMNVYLNLPKKTIDSLNDIMDIANAERPDIPSMSDPSDIEAAIKAYQTKLENYVGKLAGIDAGMTAGAGVFIELGAGGSKTFFNDRLWIRAAPSMFFTLLHMKNNDISLKGYSDQTNNKYGLSGSGSMKLYSAWDLDDDVNPFASPGFDLTLEARYALWSVLDLGLNVSHIPIAPSKLTHSKSINAEDISMTVDASPEKIMSDPESAIDFNIPELDSLLEDSESENEKVRRPVRFDFYMMYKPFKSPILVVRPNIGATINSAAGAGLLNWGINIEFNAPVIFSASIGTGLTEGLWANRVGISLDFRVFEVDLAAALAGADFAGSFSPKNGMIAAIGFKVGL
jgi:hypothetical protein